MKRWGCSPPCTSQKNKDFARTVSFPPAEAIAASKLIMNWQGSVWPLNLGREMGLYVDGQGVLCKPSDSGDLLLMDLGGGRRLLGVPKIG